MKHNAAIARRVSSWWIDVRLTKGDKRFLRAVGIAPEPLTSFAEEHLALAQRIAKHEALVQVKVSPEAARLQLLRLAARKILEAAQADGTLRLMEEHHIPVTRHNYLMLAFLGNPPAEPLPAEIEMELPWFLREEHDE
jgi:hypothetical protein